MTIRTQPSRLVTGLLLALGLAVALIAFTGRSGSAAVAPAFVPGNPHCVEFGLLGSADINQGTGGSYAVGSGTVTINKTSLSTFDWSSDIGIDKVIVKAGPGANVYSYDEAFGDTGLVSPTNPGNQKPFDISHVQFCYDQPVVDPGLLSVSTTATASYDRTVIWDIVKTVDPASHSGNAGEIAGSSIWTVVATKNQTLGNFQIIGSTTVGNTNSVAVDVALANVLSDNTAVITDCAGFFSIPAGGSVTCNFALSPAGNGANLNTATADFSFNGAPIVQKQATAAITFAETLIGDDEVDLADDRGPLAVHLTDSDTFTYEETFTCSDNPSLYNNGSLTGTYPNTATLVGPTTNLSDTAEVVVTCTLDALVPTKTADGTYDRTVTWTLTKVANPTSFSGVAGQVFSPADLWTVVATKSESLGNYEVTGAITIANPASIAQTFSLTDVLDDGTVVTLTCPSNTIAAGASVVCTYTAAPDDGTAILNTATVTAPGNDDQTATADVGFTETLIGDDEVDLADPRFNFLQENIASSTTETFDDTFSCAPATSTLYMNDKYSFTVINTATLTGENTDLNATATVTVNCAKLQQASIAINSVTITSSTKGTNGTVNGTFTIQNMSGGEVTEVTLGQVTQTFRARGQGGTTWNLTGTCTVTPPATGATLQPHEVKVFAYSCTVNIPTGAREMTTIVTVQNATNQAGQVRIKLWSATSSPYNY